LCLCRHLIGLFYSVLINWCFVNFFFRTSSQSDLSDRTHWRGPKVLQNWKESEFSTVTGKHMQLWRLSHCICKSFGRKFPCDCFEYNVSPWKTYCFIVILCNYDIIGCRKCVLCNCSWVKGLRRHVTSFVSLELTVAVLRLFVCSWLVFFYASAAM
jgi:hypothetical protein